MAATKIKLTEMKHLLGRMSEHLTTMVSQYPGISSAALALAEAAKDPRKSPDGIKVAAKVSGKAKAVKAAKPVGIDYEEGNILVTNVPFGKAHFAMNRIFGVEKPGVFQKAPGKEYDGDQVYKTCKDKSKKAYVLPMEKLQAVIDWFKGENINVKVAKAA